MKEGKRAAILKQDVKKHIGVPEQYYTRLETIFLRISQFFENDLAPDKWHTELLRKMNLRTEGVREMVSAEAVG